MNYSVNKCEATLEPPTPPWETCGSCAAPTKGADSCGERGAERIPGAEPEPQRKRHERQRRWVAGHLFSGWSSAVPACLSLSQVQHRWPVSRGSRVPGKPKMVGQLAIVPGVFPSEYDDRIMGRSDGDVGNGQSQGWAITAGRRGMED